MICTPKMLNMSFAIAYLCKSLDSGTCDSIRLLACVSLWG